jgi:hypothetical protein
VIVARWSRSRAHVDKNVLSNVPSEAVTLVGQNASFERESLWSVAI